MPLAAADIIRLLELAPHPEGGHYREVFRDPAGIGTARPASTAIYFLLQRGEVSRWHRVDAAEVWHWYAGAPLRLSTFAGETGADPASRTGTAPVRHQTLGSDLGAGERPQLVIPARVWQQAESRGDFTLAGCTVAPGFSFAGFEMAPAGWAP